jgi:hypothetical protein
MDQRLLVAQLNVEHYRRKLDGVLGDAERRTIGRLLAEEEAKLGALRTAIAEKELSAFLGLFAQRAAVLFDAASPKRDIPGLEAGFAAVLDKLPFAAGLIDGEGETVLSNGAMQVFAPGQMPSRDPRGLERWRFLDGNGNDRPLGSYLWPGARALRGEAVTPGIEATFLTDDGQEISVRVAAVPVRSDDATCIGALAAAYQPGLLATDEFHTTIGRLLSAEKDRSAGTASRQDIG